LLEVPGKLPIVFFGKEADTESNSAQVRQTVLQFDLCSRISKPLIPNQKKRETSEHPEGENTSFIFHTLAQYDAT
jgi:hypothetical protein